MAKHPAVSTTEPEPEPAKPAHILADLRCLRETSIHHRTIAAGEVLARIQFRSDADRRWFRGNLRWSNFGLQDLNPET